MPDTDDIHNQLRTHQSFRQLMETLADERASYQLVTAVEGVGREKGKEIDPDTAKYISDRELGWLWLVWEAYHSDGRPAKLEGGIA